MPDFTVSTAIKLILALAVSFGLGLLVFYVPERGYRAVPEVWLPSAAASRDGVLALPVKTLSGWQKGVRFLPLHPGDPEILELDAAQHGLKASDCPNVFNAEEVSPTKCSKAGMLDGEAVYTIRRQAVSHNLQVYTQRGGTLVVVTGLHSKKEAMQYLRSFQKVARRDAAMQLAANRAKADEVAAGIRRDKQAEEAKRAASYKRLPYDPVLPATLPANWIQYSVRVSGGSEKSPTIVDVLYKKGKERFIGLTIVPRTTFTLGTACGPTPGANDTLVPCSPVPDEGYYTGGVNEPDRLTLYIYRPIGDVVAIVHTSVHSDNGQPLLFSEDTLRSQKSIAKSLRVADKSRLEGAFYVGVSYDPYPDISPRP
jgi:hypothetical protein